MAKAKPKAKPKTKPKATPKPKISEEAKEIAASNLKSELVAIAKEDKIKIDPKAKEEVIAQALLDAGVKFEEVDEGDQDTGEDKPDNPSEDGEDDSDDESAEEEADEDADEEEEGEGEDIDDDEDTGVEPQPEAEEEEEVTDKLKAPTGLFVAKKAGTSVKVYWPNGNLCRVYTKKEVKNPAEAAELFIKKKNNQVGSGMGREGRKGKPVYPKGMVRETQGEARQ